MNKTIFIILILACLLAYAGYLGGGFVFDDRILVKENPLVKSAYLLPTVFRTGIYDYWTGAQPYDRMYRPVQMFSYYLDYCLWGLNPAGFRFGNILLHLLNSFLVFYLLFLIFKQKFFAASAALLFLAHPVHISTVAYISARADLLSAFFILSSCALFIKFLGSGRYSLYSLSILAAALALLSRENTLLISGFLMIAASASGKKQAGFRYLPVFVVLSFAYLVVRFVLFGPSGLASHPAYTGMFFSLLNFANVICRYVLLLFCPLNLRMFHCAAFIEPISPAALMLSVLVSVLVFALIHERRRIKRLSAPVSFGISWFLLAIVPVFFYLSAYPDLGMALMAESWLYLPSAGFCAILAYMLLPNKAGRFILFVCVLSFCGIISANRVYWRDEPAFYERTLRFLPPGNIIMRNLAFAYIESGDLRKAYDTIKGLERYYADTPVVNTAWGRYYLARGRADKALEYYRLILNKSFFNNYSVSLCYAKLGDVDKAIAFSLASFRQNHFFRENIVQLSLLYGKSGHPEEAEKYALMAIGLDPKNGKGLTRK